VAGAFQANAFQSSAFQVTPAAPPSNRVNLGPCACCRYYYPYYYYPRVRDLVYVPCWLKDGVPQGVPRRLYVTITGCPGTDGTYPVDYLELALAFENNVVFPGMYVGCNSGGSPLFTWGGPTGFPVIHSQTFSIASFDPFFATFASASGPFAFGCPDFTPVTVTITE
jgi:hypothetical protein